MIYEVTLYETWARVFTVEAISEADALDIAAGLNEDGDQGDSFNFVDADANSNSFVWEVKQ